MKRGFAAINRVKLNLSFRLYGAKWVIRQRFALFE